MLYGDNHYRFSRPVFITLVLTELANPDMLFPVSAMLQAGSGLHCMTLLCMLVRLHILVVTWYWCTWCTWYWCSITCFQVTCDSHGAPMYAPMLVHLTKPLLADLSACCLTCSMPLQIVILGLWMYCLQYFAFPAVLLAILLVGTAISVSLTYRQRRTLANICSQTYVVPYVRKGYVRATIARRLIPGDVVVVQQGIAVCDMVLLRGNCLVEDSMISGDVRTIPPCPVCEFAFQALWFGRLLQGYESVLPQT